MDQNVRRSWLASVIAHPVAEKKIVSLISKDDQRFVFTRSEERMR